MADEVQNNQPVPRAVTNTAKIPPPRTLNKVETLDTLNQWKTTVRNFYRRDDLFKRFLQANTTWDLNAANYGFDDEEEGLRRSAEDLTEDLNVFLNLISGYLPFSFLKEKLETETTSMESVWDMIFEVYGHEVTQDSFLNIVDIPRDEGETHRQFFERINSHVRKHLTPANITAAGMNSGPNGDAFNITLGNLVVAHWMKLTHPKLVKLVRLEFAAELKNGTQLVTLLPRIARNVDTLLAKAEGTVNMLAGNTDVEDAVEAHLNRMGYRGARASPGDKFKSVQKDFKRSPPQPRARQACHHCELLKQKLKVNLNTDHSPDTCFRQKVSLRVVKENVGSEVESDTGQDPAAIDTSSNLLLFQSMTSARVPGSPDVQSNSGVVSNQVMSSCPSVETSFTESCPSPRRKPGLTCSTTAMSTTR